FSKRHAHHAICGKHKLDPFARRSIFSRNRWNQPAAGFAHHGSWSHRDSFFLDGNSDKGKGILHLHADSSDRHARRFYGARLCAVLHLLGSHARSDVLPDRYLGRTTKALCRNQIFPLHISWFRIDAPWYPDAILLQPERRQSTNVRHIEV